MFKKLFMISALFLFTSVLHAETYSCNLYVENALIKPIIENATFVDHSIVLDMDENEPVSIVIAKGSYIYNFMFSVTTSHKISIQNPDRDLSCKTEEKFLKSGILMKVDCYTSNDVYKPFFYAYCQEITVWN